MPMLRLPWTIVNGITAMCLLSAAVLLMVPTEFHRHNNETITIPIDWSNLMCEIPKPNINVTEREVYDFWQLPTRVRLSPRMVESGRCCVAVDQYNSKRPYKIDPSVCYCFNTWWVPVVSLVSLVLGLLSLLHFVAGVITRKIRMIPDNEVSAHSRWEMVRNILFAVVTLIVLANVRNDFTFTNYGDLYPSDYLNSLPMTWLVAMWLFLGGNAGQFITCIFLKSCAKRCSKPKKTNQHAPAPIVHVPPPKFELHKAFQNASVQTRVTYSGMRIERESPNTGSITSRAKSTVSGPPSPSPTVLFTVCECVSLSDNSETVSSLSSIMLTTTEEIQSKAADQNAKSEMSVGKEEVVRKEDKQKEEEKEEGPSPTLPVIPTIVIEPPSSEAESTKTEAKPGPAQPTEKQETLFGPRSEGKDESKPEPPQLIVTPGIAVKVSGGNEQEKPKSEMEEKSQKDGKQSGSERQDVTKVVHGVADDQGGKKV